VVLSPAANARGWFHANSVSARITASDAGGSGVRQIRFWIDSGPVSSVSNSSAQVSISGAGRHTLGVCVLDGAGNVSPLITRPVKIEGAK
jgi:hypothetical protein